MGGMMSTPSGMNGSRVMLGFWRLCVSASGNVAGSFATVAGSDSTDSRDGVSSAPACAAAAWVSFEVRYWTSSQAASLLADAELIQVPNGCTRPQLTGLTSVHGSDQN